MQKSEGGAEMARELKMWVNGTDVSEWGIHVLRLPVLDIPEEEIIEYKIAGRPEPLIERKGQYIPIVRTVECYCKSDAPLDGVRKMLEAETVRFGNEADKVCDCVATDYQELPRLLLDWHRFAFKFRCAPLKRQHNPDRFDGTTISAKNIGNVDALPTITITPIDTKAVVLRVGEQTCTFQGMTEAFVVNSEMGSVKSGTKNVANKMTGAFPTIPAGETVEISVSNASAMEVRPNWRWR